MDLALLCCQQHNVYLHVVSVCITSVDLCVEQFEYKLGHITRLYYACTMFVVEVRTPAKGSGRWVAKAGRSGKSGTFRNARRRSAPEE